MLGVNQKVSQEARMALVCSLHTSAAGGAVWDRGEPGDKPVPSCSYVKEICRET